MGQGNSGLFNGTEGSNNFPGATTEESIDTKLKTYLLDLTHSDGGSKATWFEKALGFTQHNIDEFKKQIVFDIEKATETVSTQYGQKYSQFIPIKGANGKVISVEFIWILNNDGIVRLVTAKPTARKVANNVQNT
jgi:hypothetical protein